MAKVLVVDDDMDILGILKIRLESWGHVVLAAASAEAASRAIAELGKPDVAVVDVAMPHVNGLDLVRSLKTRPEMREVPVIFLSAMCSPEDIAKGKALGGQYLTKPFQASDLSAALERTLSRGF
jgi:DNA-binding response OmpR family regulator